VVQYKHGEHHLRARAGGDPSLSKGWPTIGCTEDRVDQMVELATCLRKKGYDVDDPTAETLKQWGKDFRVEFPWDDPAAKEAYEECSSGD
jgi:hypothetical protein